MCGSHHKGTGTGRNRKTAQSKEKNKSPDTNPKEMEVYELPDNKFKLTGIYLIKPPGLISLFHNFHHSLVVIKEENGIAKYVIHNKQLEAIMYDNSRTGV